MSRSYLFVTWEGGGNVPPVLGVARRLAARGHAVRVLAEPCLASAVADAGAAFVPFERHFTRADRAETLLDDAAARTPLGALARSFERVVFGPARVVAEETRRALAEGPTDVVVADAMLPGALLAAEAAGLPRVVLFHMPEFLPGPGRPAAGPGFLPRTDSIGRLRDAIGTAAFRTVLRRSLAPYNDARGAMGLAPLASPDDLVREFHRADRRLLQTSRAFDFPITPAPANVRYVGPVLDAPDWATDGTDPWPDDDRPLVAVSLSTTFQNQHATLARIVDALGRLPGIRGLVTLGPAMAGADLALPPNVRAVASAPHDEVFAQAAAVVTHAGHGTVMRALAHGCPLLCLPMGRDQDDNAARVVVAGAGLRLRPSAPAARIAAALTRVLGEASFCDAAARLGAIIRADAASNAAVDELESVGAPARAVLA